MAFRMNARKFKYDSKAFVLPNGVGIVGGNRFPPPKNYFVCIDCGNMNEYALLEGVSEHRAKQVLKWINREDK